MDSEDIVICTLNNKRPFSYSLGMSPRIKQKFSLATEPSFTIVQKEKKSRIFYILLFTKQCCNSAFCFVTKVQNTHTLYDTTIYWI